jgi:hypothetical protein
LLLLHELEREREKERGREREREREDLNAYFIFGLEDSAECALFIDFLLKEKNDLCHKTIHIPPSIDKSPFWWKAVTPLSLSIWPSKKKGKLPSPSAPAPLSLTFTSP